MKLNTDEALVRAVQEGDIHAYELLVRRYERILFSFVHHIVWNAHTAEEVIQDTLFVIYTKIETIDPKKKFSTFVFEVAKNRAISELRKHKPTVSLEAVEIAEDESMYELLARKSLGDNVKQALHILPTSYARVISLYYFEGLSYEEIAHKLSLPLNTVRTHLSRGKERLKRVLNYET